MKDLNEYVIAYQKQLQEGKIQIAYKGIMSFMGNLKSYLSDMHSDYLVGALYFGYMDMTYFAITTTELKDKQLKIAVVYLHQENCFELWLSATNKKIQAQYIDKLKDKDLKGYKLSVSQPGIDSIIESRIIDHPNFNELTSLKVELDILTQKFIKDIMEMMIDL